MWNTKRALNTCRCHSSVARVNIDGAPRRLWHPSYWFNLILDRLEYLLSIRKEAKIAAETATVLSTLNKYQKSMYSHSEIMAIDLTKKNRYPNVFQGASQVLVDGFFSFELSSMLGVGVSSISNVQNWTFICGFCVESVHVCPLCAERYTKTARCFALEELASVIQVKCRHTPCNEWVKLSCLKFHMEKSCEYRPIVCNIPFKTRCKSKPIEFSEYPGHLLSAHSAVYSLSRKVAYYIIGASVAKRSGKWVPRPFLYHNKSFILNVEIKNSVLMIWVTGMFSEISASAYLAEIRIGNKCDAQGQVSSKCNFKWILDIMTVRKEMSEMRRSCFVKIPLSKLSTFADTTKESDESYFFYVEPNIITTTGIEDHLAWNSTNN